MADSSRPYCLGIETSCDETAMALVRQGRMVEQIVLSQAGMHNVFGGVVPEMASREHYRALMPLARRVLERAGVSLEEIGVVAVARGPGLLGALLTGLGFAKGLVLGTGATLIGVNHLHAHLLAAGLEQELPFPALGVLVSGGHTHLYRVDAVHDFTLLGRTLDDAAGEAFDKVAKMLNLPYPGGRHVDELGRAGKVDRKMFTRPYVDNDNLDFSFSGLKTAVANKAAQVPEAGELVFGQVGQGLDVDSVPGVVRDICASFNWTVADTLRLKAERALQREKGIRSLIVAGGVAANSVVREVFLGLGERCSLPVVLPSPAMCTDNAAMIAYAGDALARYGFHHDLTLEAIPRGRPIPDDMRR